MELSEQFGLSVEEASAIEKDLTELLEAAEDEYLKHREGRPRGGYGFHNERVYDPYFLKSGIESE